MAHLPKQLRIMRNLLTIAACLLCCISAHAQTYKPLEPVEVPDTYSTIVNVERNEMLSGEKYYSASHLLGIRRMTADLDVPANCDLALDIDADIKVGMTAVLSVGGENYYLSVSFVSARSNEKNSIHIDLLEDHLKHIAVSGLQSITFRNNGDVVHDKQFNAIEQELWRRTAEELGRAAYIIY